MVTTTKHYISFLFPGIFFTETSDMEISERDHKLVNLLEGAFGYRFYDRTEVRVDGEILTGKNKNFSPITYIGGTVYTREEVKKLFPELKSLYHNLVHNGWTKVIHTPFGNWFPLHEGDTII